MQQLCGSDFVKDCGYEDNTIFTCSGEGSTPVFQEKCPKQCVHSMVTNTSRCIGGTCDCPRIGAPKNVSLISISYIVFCGCPSEYFEAELSPFYSQLFSSVVRSSPQNATTTTTPSTIARRQGKRLPCLRNVPTLAKNVPSPESMHSLALKRRANAK